MSKLKIAIQKSGRLKDDSLKLLKQCGISIDNGKDQLKAEASNFPLEVYYLRNSDIPKYVQDGIVNLGIIGENVLYETESQLEVISKLNFSKCRVSLAVPKDIDVADINYFEGKKIATSYPNTLARYFSEYGIETRVHKISGSVEIAPNIGLADAICDIVSTGSTLFKNGLKETNVILKSEAVLVEEPNPTAEIRLLIDKLNFRIRAVLRAKTSKYILMNVPNEKISDVAALLPVLKSPTILPLAKEGWSSLHTVIDENDFWEVIDQLKDAGAEGILVAPIEKIIE
ncbi:MAG: ATP phosphoribosyltransferase [Crocinitomicaceae bacterium]|nr:ATP phosphoribosyltransferase [Crocinitomicaceae bacterium]